MEKKKKKKPVSRQLIAAGNLLSLTLLSITPTAPELLRRPHTHTSRLSLSHSQYGQESSHPLRRLHGRLRGLCSISFNRFSGVSLTVLGFICISQFHVITGDGSLSSFAGVWSRRPRRLPWKESRRRLSDRCSSAPWSSG